MKRYPELLPLSQAHYHALKLALDTKRAVASGDAERIALAAAAVRQTMARELEPHFRTEETLLLPAMKEAGCAELVARTLVEHRLMREMAASLGEPQAGILQGFADLLQAHVRFEERELFEAAQVCLDPATLKAIAAN